MSDGVVAPLDALYVINELNDRVNTFVDGTFMRPDRPTGENFLDVDGNGKVSPVDALAVINVLPAATSALVAGEPTVASPAPHRPATIVAKGFQPADSVTRGEESKDDDEMAHWWLVTSDGWQDWKPEA